MIESQADYYRRTAEDYDRMHLAEPEHELAFALLAGVANAAGITTLLDVGAGTGRVLRSGAARMPTVRMMGVEPVDALREQAYAHGVSREELLPGDGTALAFSDQSFDLVCAFGILHHVAKPEQAVAEMLRVGRHGIFISDLNCYGCGSFPQRLVAQSLRFVKLWRLFQWMKTGGKMSKYSEADGVFYSFSVFDVLPQVRRQMKQIHLMGTRGTGTNLFCNASHVALLALRENAPFPRLNRADPVAGDRTGSS